MDLAAEVVGSPYRNRLEDSRADAVARMVEGPLTAMVPASALQMHPHATVIVDEAAAAGLSLRDYYREIQRNKPGWQR